MSDGGELAGLPESEIAPLVALPEAEAVARLQARGWWSVATATALAEWALEQAAVDLPQANGALRLATLIAGEFGAPEMLMAQIAYAEARRATHAGDLAGAENSLRRAQELWRRSGAQASFARTFLGLTQVLAMQGRFDEARVAAQGGIDALLTLVNNDPSARLLLSRAYRNRANLNGYQEQHAAARDDLQQAINELEQLAASTPPASPAARELDAEYGHLALNLASAHTFLDAPDEAAALLSAAIARFDAAGDQVNRGRAQTNLGRLYARVGEYAAALRAFDLAARDLIGDMPPDVALGDAAELGALRLADELLLEHALAYLSLNLLPEANVALERSVRLFRQTNQPYELAQSLYTLGMLRLQQGDLAASAAALDEALALYGQLGNPFWHNRTQIARARLLLALGERDQAAIIVGALLAAPELVTADGAVAWDLLGLVDGWLLQVQLSLDAGAIESAENAASEVATLLGITDDASAAVTPLMPHLVLRWLHARGQCARARGENALARRYFADAVEVLDRQRGTLPLEEVRTAYLDDKMAIYSDLVVTLLAAPLPAEDEVAAAFAVVERARSRALLERLLASIDVVVEDERPEIAEQRAALRRQLHWLYNQLLGESGSRRADGGLSREVAQHEAAIAQLEWRNAPLLAQAEPVSVGDLQAALDGDQQALVYYFAGDEILAFVISPSNVRVVRQVSSVAAITAAQAELRFQLGRVEVGAAYVTRHQERLQLGIQGALARLYALLLAPLEDHLHAARILLIPYGTLHLIPFHALYDGTGYWLERVEVSYVPSASIAVHKQRSIRKPSLTRFAGLAPYDPRIPQAQAEIEAAASNFADARCYHHQEATLANLRHAAANCDVLHLATHGLFRPDNSFFSAIKLADGWMDVRELYRLPLAATLVVLSACESGVGEVRAGDEVVGLARGFLAAGTHSLIASLWNVHDSSAAQLMECFYRTLQGDALAVGSPGETLVRPAAALRMAQINALRQGEHPYYWAPFFAIG